MKNAALVFSFMICGCTASPDPVAQPQEPIPSVDTTSASPAASGDALTLADGSVFQTGLHQATLLGTVKGMDGKVYLVMSGRHCTGCEAETALYVHAPADGPLVVEDGKNARMYPGRALDGETNEPYYVARAFFGDILQGVPGVIWYSRALDTDGTMQEHTMLLDVTAYLEESRQPGHALLEKTLKQVSMGLCQEIPGVERTAAP